MNPKERYEWRYLPRGDRLHALIHSHCSAALCGLGVWESSNWRGTGSQAEYERAASLLSCQQCSRKLA